jgi:hypothetical protein
VITNAQGTIAKFSRIGHKAGFGSRKIVMIRNGTRYVHDANAARPEEFEMVVNAPEYKETWVEGMNVYHNPNARIPLPMGMLPGAAHHFLRDDGRLGSFIPAFHPYGSITRIVVIE